jgi:hypothetical protein
MRSVRTWGHPAAVDLSRPIRAISPGDDSAIQRGDFQMSEAVPFEFARTRIHQFDLPAEVESLRERHPVARMRYPSDRLGWVVTSHDLARQVLTTPASSK